MTQSEIRYDRSEARGVSRIVTTVGTVRGGPQVRSRQVSLLVAAAAAILVAAVVLRFWTRSPLWLDEAQSVAIARLPLSGHGTTMWTGLRQDGSPPLYYLLLHGWIRLFGTSDLAVRSLSGVLSLLAFPLVWRLGRLAGGRRVATVSVLLLATSPFAVRFATETRMYSLVVLLSALGGLALHRMLTGPRSVWPVLGVAAASAGLALTHYWTLFLLIVVVAALVLRRAWGAVGAVALGAVPFLPWLPSFLYQLRHTGTPWGAPAAPSAIVHAVADWCGGGSTTGRLLLLVVVALLAFGLFGRPIDARHVELDLRGRPPGRLLALITLGSLLVAVAVNQVVHGAWQDRYTAIVFVPFLIWAGLGIRSLASPRVAVGVIGVAALLGLATAAPDVTTDRTNAASVAAVLKPALGPHDVVAVCPDQLGPALTRLLPADVQVVAIPTLQPAGRVDWVDYAGRQKAAQPTPLADRLSSMAGTSGTVWYVVSQGYRTYETLCTDVQRRMDQLRVGTQVITDDAKTFEHEGLIRYAALRPVS